ncbi:MAG: hypothetical protein K2X79_07840, partial [Burkholderiaceae bacterium]|nr:hypothetical protein [Burkholderiaceae bacterium]
LLEQAVIATAKDFGKDIDGHACKTGLPPPWVTDQRSPFSRLGEMGAFRWKTSACAPSPPQIPNRRF